MFSTSRKQAQQIAHELLSGHCALVAWWTLRHAGVLEAMKKSELDSGEGLAPLVYASRTSMAPDVLEALLDYLAAVGLVTLKKEGACLTPEGHALLDHEEGVLGMMRAYQPVLDFAEHLLARLKTYGPAGSTGGSGGGGASVFRKSEYLVDSQGKRYAAEVFPAVAELVTKYKLSHLLDVTCGTGDLLVHVAQHEKRAVGIGIGAESSAVRRANETITQADLEKRLIAVTANPVETCTDTQRTFDRIGISRQLWKSIDCLVATNLLSELPTGKSGENSASLAPVLAGVARHFPSARFMLMEPVASARFQRNYYAAELTLLLRLARAAPWPVEKWREALAASHFSIAEEVPLTTDGLVIFLCKPPA